VPAVEGLAVCATSMPENDIASARRDTHHRFIVAP
jgi:hypothetical protein